MRLRSLLFSGFIALVLLTNAADFDHTKATVNRLQRSEVRLLGCLLIAQSVLSDHLGKERPTEGYFNGVMVSQ